MTCANPGQYSVAGHDVHTKVIPRTIRGYAMDPKLISTKMMT